MSGSHRQFKHPSKPGVVTIAGKPSATLPPGTEQSILKQAGVRRPWGAHRSGLILIDPPSLRGDPCPGGGAAVEEWRS
jgi:HicA toxin of bacterial toxin-antitoxin,